MRPASASQWGTVPKWCVSLALACGAGSSPTSDALPDAGVAAASRAAFPEGASGCEDVLTPRSQRAACVDSPPSPYGLTHSPCAQTTDHPQRELSWRFWLAPATDAAALEHEHDCVYRQLRELLGTKVRQASSTPRALDDISASATFAEIESVLYSAAVQKVELSVAAESCRTLSEEPCVADGYCQPIFATRLGALACQQERRFFACRSYGPGCPQNAPTISRLDDGSCWQWADSCPASGTFSSFQACTEPADAGCP
jgi:hypothetical protein